MLHTKYNFLPALAEGEHFASMGSFKNELKGEENWINNEV